MKKTRVVILDVVGLSPRHFRSAKEHMPHLSALSDAGRFYEMKPVFPAVTLPVQASLTTGVYPETHGVVANGFYFPETFHVAFWEQAAGLVQAEKVWDRIRKRNPELKTAVLFFQNSLYATCDVVITPKPLHTDDGLLQWCYSKPVGLYEDIADAIGPFNLMHYWGPLASIESSRWIARAALEVMVRENPDLMFVYLPHLDYCSQRLGPNNPGVERELGKVDREVGRIIQGIGDQGLEDKITIVVLSEYTFSGVQGDVAINRYLREKGLLEVRTIQGREYLDMELSPAFAMVDHQVAHVYVKPGYEGKVKETLEAIDGIDFLLDGTGKRQHRINHRRAGDLVAVSARDRWFSYYWWADRDKEPDFASHIDIHRKPGYDPLELFPGLAPRTISQDVSLIRGSHGYPPTGDQDSVPLIISGVGSSQIKLPKRPCVTDIACAVEALFNQR